MKTFSDDALAALERGDAIVSAAIEILPPGGSPIRLWGGFGTMSLPADGGDQPYNGIGDRGLIQNSAGSIGGTAQALTLSLSGIEPKAIDVLDAAEIEKAPCVVRRLIFDNTGKTLLGAYVFTRGRVDTVQTVETIGGQAGIQVSVESAARALGRHGGRLRSDADQRLVKPTDGFFRIASYAGNKTAYWGGKKPATVG